MKLIRQNPVDSPPLPERDARRGYQSIISEQLRIMRVGESVTFTRQLKHLPLANAGNLFSQMISSYLARRRPGCRFTQESFTMISHAGNVYAGVIVTMIAERTDSGDMTGTDKGA